VLPLASSLSTFPGSGYVDASEVIGEKKRSREFEGIFNRFAGPSSQLARRKCHPEGSFSSFLWHQLCRRKRKEDNNFNNYRFEANYLCGSDCL
jgi:hypothetical protein